MKKHRTILFAAICNLLLPIHLSAQLPLTTGTSFYSDSPQREIRLVYQPQNGSWDTLKQFTYSYSSPISPSNTLLELFQNGILEPTRRTTQTYNLDGKVLTVTSELYQNGAWIDNTKTEKSYDHNGYLISCLDKFKNGASWDTLRLLQYSYTYNIDQLPSTRISRTWVGSGIIDIDSVITHYNSRGETDTIFQYDISTQTSFPTGFSVYGAWVDFQLGLPQSFDQYSWDGNVQNLLQSEDFQYTNGQLSRYESESHFPGWTPRRHIKFYDSLGYMVLDSNLEINGQQWQTTTCYRFEYARNPNHRLTEILISRLGIGSYSPSERYIFENFWTSAKPLIQPVWQLEIGPNPTNSMLNIRTSMPQKGPSLIQLIDMQGCLRMETINPKSNTESQILLPANLPTGNYLLVLRNRNNHATAKVQILR